MCLMAVALGFFILRVVAGLTIAAHGAQKLFGWFDGPGLDKWKQGIQTQGFKPPLLWTSLVILGELGGGLSRALGFLTPLGAAGIVGVMVMAIAKAHWGNGFFNSKRGFEFPLLLLTIAVAIGIMGPGSYSLDALFGIALPDAPIFLVLALLAIITDIIGFIISRPTEPAGARSGAS
jgi:putative oxidoreductase